MKTRRPKAANRSGLVLLPEDVEITHRLCAVGELVGIRVVDHVVVAEGGYVSFLERGMIP